MNTNASFLRKTELNTPKENSNISSFYVKTVFLLKQDYCTWHNYRKEKEFYLVIEDIT